MIYADNAATTKMSDSAVKVMNELMCNVFGDPAGKHNIGRKASDILVDARKKIAVCLGCEENEIIFTSGGSESVTQAIISAAMYGMKMGRKHIVSSETEHSAVMNTLSALEKRGFEITYVGVDGKGRVDPADIEVNIRKDTCLVSIIYANNETGIIQPIRNIGKICRKHKVLFHTDAVQAIGHIHTDVKKDSTDMLSLSAHKFGGPKGVGALYVRDGVPVTQLIKGGQQEAGRRAGTENVPGIAAMAVALEEKCRNMTEISEKVSSMRKRLISALGEIEGSVFNGDISGSLDGIVNFSFPGADGEKLVLMLNEKGICTSTGVLHCADEVQAERVLLAMGRTPEEACSSLKISINEENTEDEIEQIITAVEDSVKTIRNSSIISYA